MIRPSLTMTAPAMGLGLTFLQPLSGQFQCDGHVIRIVQCGASFTNDGTPMAQPWPVPWFTAVKTAIKNALNRYRSRQKNIKTKAQFLCHTESMGVGGTQKPWNDSSFQGTFNQPQKAHKRVHVIVPSSFIQTVLSASEFHRIMPCGSWAVPPVGNCTPALKILFN